MKPPLRPFRGSFWPQGALLRAPKVLGRPQEAKFGLKCQRLVHLGGPHQYQVLWPLKRPLRHSRGPQKGPFWPQGALLRAPKVLGRPQEAKFGLKCQRLVHLGGPHQYQVLWPLKRPLRPSRGPQKGPFLPQEALWGPPRRWDIPRGPVLVRTAINWLDSRLPHSLT